MYDEAGVLAGVRPAVGQHSVEVAWLGLAIDEVAVLEDGGCVSEDIVDGSQYVALSVELSEGLSKKRVLIGANAALVEDGAVGDDPDREGLSAVRPCVVLEPDVLCKEPVAKNSCN